MLPLPVFIGKGHGLREPEVDDLDESHMVDEQVLGLQISIHNVQAMHVREGADDAGGIELSYGLDEAPQVRPL